jgi:hypothetical protein
MKKKTFILKNFSLIVIFILFIFCGCNSDQSAWDLTQKSDSLEKYQDFLDKYPDSDHAQEAKNFIAFNLPSEYKSALDLMLVFWFNSRRPKEREGVRWFGTSSLMFNATSIEVSGTINLDSTRYSKRIISKLDKYDDVSCIIKGENIEYDYNGTQTIIDSNSVYSCKLDGKLKYEIKVLNGEFGLQKDKEFYIKDGTKISINNTTYEYMNMHWNKK